MGSYNKFKAMFFMSVIFMAISLPPMRACGFNCHLPPHPPHGCTPKCHRGKGGGHGGGHGRPKQPPMPPIVLPPIIINPPPVITPPVTNPPVIIMPPPSPGGGYPPYGGVPPGGGGGGRAPPGRGGGPPGGGIAPSPSPTKQPTCPIDALKLGACVDVLGGLVHIGLGDPVKNVCCPVIKGLLELEAAICLCTILRIKLLNLKIFLPLALQLLITCGKTPPPGFVCPPLT